MVCGTECNQLCCTPFSYIPFYVNSTSTGTSRTAGFTQHVPWLAHIVRAIPSTGVAMQRFGAFAVKQAKVRFSKEVEKKDLFYHLVRIFKHSFLGCTDC